MKGTYSRLSLTSDPSKESPWFVDNTHDKIFVIYKVKILSKLTFLLFSFSFSLLFFPSVKEKGHAAPPSRLPRQRKKLLLPPGSSGRKERNFACFPFLLLWIFGGNEKVNNKSSLKLSKLIKMKNLIDRLEDMVIMLHLKPIPKTRKKILCRLPFFLQMYGLWCQKENSFLTRLKTRLITFEWPALICQVQERTLIVKGTNCHSNFSAFIFVSQSWLM